MTTQEIKSEIQKSLQHVPEGVLLEVLALLQQAQDMPEESLKRVKNLRRILDEDKMLLEQLAK